MFCPQDGDQFEQQLKVIRRTQMGPLSAASMESGSYQRGYEFIARYDTNIKVIRTTQMGPLLVCLVTLGLVHSQMPVRELKMFILLENKNSVESLQ